MIDLMLDHLSLSLKNRRGILMIWDLRRTPVIKVATDQIRYEVERVTLSVVTLIMKRSQGLDPWTDGSKGLIQAVPGSQNPRTVGMRTLQMEGV